MLTQGQLQEIQAGVASGAAKKHVEFDSGIESGKVSTKAALTTALNGVDNDIDYSAHTAGLAGNSVSIQYALESQPGETVRVKVSGDAIVVRLARATSAVAAKGTMTSDATNPDPAGTFVLGAETYSFVSALTEAYASAVLTSDTVNPADGDTVTVNDQIYRFESSPSQANDIQVDGGGNADVTLGNLVKAINGTGTEGVEYFAGTLPATDVTAGTVTAHATTVTANTLGVGPNSYAKAETSAHLDWDGVGAVFTGGVDAVANEILIGASAAATLDNVKSAVNASAGEGTVYSTGTTANAQATATTNTDTTQLFEAVDAGASGNSVVLTESSTHITVSGSGTLEAGADIGEIETTANDVITALQASTAASALVDVSLHAGNDGTGLVTAMATTNLSGGSDGIIPLFTVVGECLVSLRAYCSKDLAGATATLVHGKTGTTNDLIPSFTATNLDKGAGIDSTGVVARGTALAKTPLKLYHDGETIFATVGTATVSDGILDYLADYIAQTEGARVEAL